MDTTEYSESTHSDHKHQSFARAQWISLIARSKTALLEKALSPYLNLKVTILKPFETVTFMAQARTGSTGERFNVGEVSIGRMALYADVVQPDFETLRFMGVAYIKGASERQVYLGAFADALLQDKNLYDNLELSLLKPTHQSLQIELDRVNRQVQSTKVEFFTIARQNSSSVS